MPKIALYDQLLDKKKEAIEKLKRPLLKKADKKRFTSAVDNNNMDIIDLQSEKLKLYENVGKVDPQKIYEVRLKIEKLENSNRIMRDEFLELFGEEMPEE